MKGVAVDKNLDCALQEADEVLMGLIGFLARCGKGSTVQKQTELVSNLSSLSEVANDLRNMQSKDVEIAGQHCRRVIELQHSVKDGLLN